MIRFVTQLICVWALLISSLRAQVAFEAQRVTGQCMATLLARSEIPTTLFEVADIIDYTGSSLADSSIPLEISFQVRPALAISPRFGIVEPGVDLRESSPNVKNIRVAGGITQLDINAHDARRQRDTGLSFGGGRAESNVGRRSDKYQGSVTGCFVLQAYTRNNGVGLATTDSTSEVCFAVERTQSGSEWAVTVGPLSFGSANTQRSNMALQHVIRVAVDLAVAQLLGRTFGLPYWRCNDVFEEDKGVIADVTAAIDRLDADKRIALRTQVMRAHGYAPYQTVEALRDAKSELCGQQQYCTATEADQLGYLQLYRPMLKSDVSAGGLPVSTEPQLDWRAPGHNRSRTSRHASAIRTPRRIAGDRPVYPRRALQRGIEAEVVAHLSISPDGRVTHAFIAESSAWGVFDDAVLRAVRKWRFNSDPFALAPRDLKVPFTFRAGTARY